MHEELVKYTDQVGPLADGSISFENDWMEEVDTDSAHRTVWMR